LIGQQGASFLAIKLWDHYETLQKTVERFWKEIKNGEIKSGEVIAEKLANLGFVQQKAYNLILFSKGSHNISNYLIDRFLIEEEKFYILLCSSKEALTSINIFKKYNKEQSKIAAAVISPEFTELERIKEHYEMSVNVIRLLYKLHISGVRKAEEWLPFSLLMHCRNTSEYNFIKMTVLDKLQDVIFIYFHNCSCSILWIIIHSSKK